MIAAVATCYGCPARTGDRCFIQTGRTAVFIPLRDDNSLRSIPFQYVTVSLIAVNILVFLLEVGGMSEAAVAGFGVTPRDLLGSTTVLAPSSFSEEQYPFGAETTLITY